VELIHLSLSQQPLPTRLPILTPLPKGQADPPSHPTLSRLEPAAVGCPDRGWFQAKLCVPRAKLRAAFATSLVCRCDVWCCPMSPPSLHGLPGQAQALLPSSEKAEDGPSAVASRADSPSAQLTSGRPKDLQEWGSAGGTRGVHPSGITPAARQGLEARVSVLCGSLGEACGCCTGQAAHQQAPRPQHPCWTDISWLKDRRKLGHLQCLTPGWQSFFGKHIHLWTREEAESLGSAPCPTSATSMP